MKNASDDRKEIKDWWEKPNTVSLIDKNLRKLETDFVLSCLGGGELFADFGCGDGISTIKYAKKVKSCFALEQSLHLLKKAKQRFKNSKIQNITLKQGDVLNLDEFEQNFNSVLTQRVVINFTSWEEQKQVLKNIHKTLKPGGIYIAVENTFEGFEALNQTRRKLGLPNIILHDWHNYFFHYDLFMEFMKDYFVLERTETFNLYYLLTRVFQNLFADFEGFGSQAKIDPIFHKADEAARLLQEIIGNQIHFDINQGRSFGPIQGFVFRKIG